MNNKQEEYEVYIAKIKKKWFEKYDKTTSFSEREIITEMIADLSTIQKYRLIIQKDIYL